MEEVSRRGEIVSPERLRAIISQSTEARVMDSFLMAVCTNCWDYIGAEEGGERRAREVPAVRQGLRRILDRVLRDDLQPRAEGEEQVRRCAART